MAIPPARLPRTPPTEAAIQTNDWTWPDEEFGLFLDDELGGFPNSATMASLATSTTEAPKFPSKRYRVIVKNEIFEGERNIAIHDTACKNAAPKYNQVSPNAY